MLRIIHNYQNTVRDNFINGEYGSNAGTYKLAKIPGFYGVPGKSIRNLFLVLSKLVMHGEVELDNNVPPKLLDHLLSMVGISAGDIIDSHHLKGGENKVMTLTAARAVVTESLPSKATLHVDQRDENDINISTQSFDGQLNVKVARWLFNMMLDNPFDVVTALALAKKNKRSVTISCACSAFSTRSSDVEVMILALIELINVTHFSESGDIDERKLLGARFSSIDHYQFSTALASAVNNSTSIESTLVVDFSNEGVTFVSSLSRGKITELYRLFSESDTTKTSNRYSLSATMIEALNTHIENSTTNYNSRGWGTTVRVGQQLKTPEPGLIFVNTLTQVNELEKYFNAQDTSLSKKTKTGSLFDYYVKNNGERLLLVFSSSLYTLGSGKVSWEISLTNAVNGETVVVCEGTRNRTIKFEDSHVIPALTTEDDLKYNLIDVCIFDRTLTQKLSRGLSIIIRKENKQSFTLNPLLIEKFHYYQASDVEDDIDYRIRNQLKADFNNVVEVLVTQRTADKLRGYRFATEPRR